MADVWLYNIQWLVGEDTGKSLNTAVFSCLRGIFICVLRRKMEE